MSRACVGQRGGVRRSGDDRHSRRGNELASPSPLLSRPCAVFVLYVSLAVCDASLCRVPQFHAAIDTAVAAITSRWGAGLLIDVHGQVRREQRSTDAHFAFFVFLCCCCVCSFSGRSRAVDSIRLPHRRQRARRTVFIGISLLVCVIVANTSARCPFGLGLRHRRGPELPCRRVRRPSSPLSLSRCFRLFGACGACA